MIKVLEGYYQDPKQGSTNPVVIKPQSKAQRRQTAYHEAGHAVIRHRVGLKPPFYRIAIYDRAYDSDTDRRAPDALGALEVMQPIMIFDADDIAADVLESLAGPTAEAKLRRVSGAVIALSFGADDYEHAIAGIDKLKKVNWPGVRTIERRASKLVTYHWSDIVIVAESLIERGCLMYDEFVELLD